MMCDQLRRYQCDRKRLLAAIFISLMLGQTWGENVASSSSSSNSGSSSSNGIDRRKPLSVASVAPEVVEAAPTEEAPGGGRRGALEYPVCGSCQMREELKTRNLEAIKDEVLRRMGFTSPPNFKGRVLPPVPPHILAKIDQGYGSGMQSDEPFKAGPSISEEEDDFHIKTETVVIYAQEYPKMRHGLWGHEIMHFQFSDGVTKYQVANATLFVHVKGTGGRTLSPSFYMELFKVTKNEHNNEHKLVKIVTRRVTQPAGRDGLWVLLDISSMVSEWFKNPRENYGFVVSGTVNGRKVIYTHSHSKVGEVDRSKLPYVEVTTKEAKRRTRRNVGLNCNDKSHETLCCRYPLTVDFEEFGWDFIIAPKRYEANYCTGECPFITLQKHPHTHLLQMASPNTTGPCCAPRKMSAISMLYFDQEMNVVYGSLPGMVVDRCGCS